MDSTPMPSLKFFNKSAGSLIVTGLIAGLLFVGLYLFSPPFLSSLNYKITDLIMVGSGKTPPSDAIVIIDLDEKSLAKYGQWPWPRHRLGDLLQNARELGAKSIALDMILAEPDRTSPVLIQKEAQRDFGANVTMRNIPALYENHDKYLADILAKGPFVLGYELLFHPSPNDGKPLQRPLNITQISKDQPDNTNQLFEARGVINNLAPFEAAVSYSGFLNATPDADGVLRRLPLLIRYQDGIFPSFALATLLQFEGRTSVQLQTGKGGSRFLQVGGRRIPVDELGNVLLNFNTRIQPFPTVSASDLLDGTCPKDLFRHKIVLIGSTASGLSPIFHTPSGPVASHVSIHAHLLETLLGGFFPLRGNNFLFYEGGGALLLALAFGFVISSTGVYTSGAVGGILIFSLWFLIRVFFQNTGYLFSPLLPTLVVVTEYALLTIIKTRKEQHHAQEAAGDALMLLKHSENTLDSIISSIPDIIFRLDATGKIIFLSPAITQYQGCTDELLGKPIFDLVAPEDRDKANYGVNERRTGERATRDLELSLLLSKEDVQKEEGARHFSISAQGLYQGTTPDSMEFIGTQGIVRDITEQKKLKKRLLQAEKMEAVGNLAAGVAHDLNNILSGLVSYPDLLLLELPEESPFRKHVLTIQQSGYRAAAIVQDMLTLARRGNINKRVFCPKQTIEEYFSSPEFHKLQERHPSIEFEATPDSDLMNVKGSPVHLSKVIMNLVTNAAEAMPAGGKIVVSSSNVYMDKTLQAYEDIPEGEYVCLSTVDNGVGISSEDLHRIFEPFYTKKKMGGSGTGLGMTVIWATVKDLGGFVDIKTKEGHGTRIDIYLPTTRESAAENNHRFVLEDYTGNEAILVVDDIKEQREIAVNMLNKLGYTVFSAASGQEALQMIQKKPVDLLVLDMIMPDGMDGLETYQHIIELFPHQKAIIASGFSESDRVRELQRLGAGTYLPKPYTLEKIGIAVRTELDRK